MMDDGILTQLVVYGWPTVHKMKRPTRGFDATPITSSRGRTMSLRLATLTSDPVSCPEVPQFPTDGGAAALRHRIYNVSTASDIRVVWKKAFRAFEAEAPLSPTPAAQLCRSLSPRQFPYCRTLKGSTAVQSVYSSAELAKRAVAAAASSPAAGTRRQNTLMLVSMPCAFTDAGANFRGALYDSRRVLNAQHRTATPRFARGTLRRYPIAAVGLTPYGHLADSHFYASTAAWVLTLLHLLPESVPVLYASSGRLDSLYGQLGVNMKRLHQIPPGG